MSDTTSNGSPGPAFPGELPPVEPPSARFIVQLFVIPAAIVLVLVVAYLAFVQLPFGRLANGGRDMMDYVRSIKGATRTSLAVGLGARQPDPERRAAGEG